VGGELLHLVLQRRELLRQMHRLGGEIPLPTDWFGQSTLTVTSGGILYGLYVLEMLLGLVLTSLAVTGFAGLLKGDDEQH
jgi:hypothetical protein